MVSPSPEANKNIIRITKAIKKLTRFEMVDAVGNSTLGKYTFLTSCVLPVIEVVPLISEPVKKFQGNNPTRKKTAY